MTAKSGARFTPKVVTANDLLEGDVVYLAHDRSWTRSHGEAMLIADPGEASALLELAQGQADMVVGPYLADAAPGESGPEPSHFKEVFRSRGPSNYPHGKQADTRPETPSDHMQGKERGDV